MRCRTTAIAAAFPILARFSRTASRWRRSSKWRRISLNVIVFFIVFLSLTGYSLSEKTVKVKLYFHFFSLFFSVVSRWGARSYASGPTPPSQIVKSFLLAFPALPAADVIPFKGLGYGDAALATTTGASHLALLILQPRQH
jgi:hypothetical protein